jgi:hypothetical protein
MTPEMRQKLAREPFEEKIRKVGQLIRLAKTFPRRKNSDSDALEFDERKTPARSERGHSCPPDC